MARAQTGAAWKWLLAAAAVIYVLLIAVPVAIYLSLDALQVMDANGKGSVTIRQRDFWEIVYFVTNAFLVIVATVALIFAFRQSIAAHRQSDAANRQNEAANQQNEIVARNAQAQVYLDMEAKFASADMLTSRKKFYLLRRELVPTDEKPLGVLAHARLQQLLDDGATCPSKLQEYTDFLRLLTFTESLGLMARRNYVLLDDIYYLLEGVLQDFGKFFLVHIRERQRSEGAKGHPSPERFFEHTIWLIHRMEGYEPAEKLPK
ncbi:hypothetical protein [Reyranella sp.]|uniref:hypothetical protein n=1 Tax=Reyranella sp. TaxID=1929291 RepID=UPI003BADA90C